MQGTTQPIDRQTLLEKANKLIREHEETLAGIEAADVVLMTDEPSKIAAVMKIARKTIGIANQNIVFALGVKFLVLVLGALGYANMWAAVFADVGVSVIAILNAIRAMRVKQPNMTA